MGNSIFPNMNLQPYTPDQAGANRGYLGIGSEVFMDYTGATNYRPSHNAHDSWIGIGRYLGKGFLVGLIAFVLDFLIEILVPSLNISPEIKVMVLAALGYIAKNFFTKSDEQKADEAKK